MNPIGITVTLALVVVVVWLDYLGSQRTIDAAYWEGWWNALLSKRDDDDDDPPAAASPGLVPA